MKKFRMVTLVVLTAAAVSGAELLKNGDFEQKFNSWKYPDWAGRAMPGAVVDDMVYGGKHAFRMGHEGDRENDLYQYLVPEPGKAMQLTLMLKADQVPENDVRIRLLARRKDKVLGWVAVPPGSGVIDLVSCGGTFDWKEFKKAIPAAALPAGTDSLLLYVKRLNNGSGNLWIDEISLTSFEEKNAVSKQEAWRPQGQTSPGSFDAAETRTGGHSYCMHQPGEPAANGIYQSIPFRPGHDTSVTLALKAVGGVPARDVTLHILTFVHGKPATWVQNPPGSGVNELVTTGGDFDWKEFKINIPAADLPEGVTSLVLFIKRRNNTAGKLYIDDMQVEYRPAAAPPQAAADRPGAVFAPGGNLWPGDGSFEAGTPFFLLPYDDREAFHGSRSLRAAPGKPIRSGYLFEALLPGKKYVLSCRVKSDRKGVFTMRASSHQWREIGRGSVELSPEWQRVTLRLPAQKIPTSISLDFTRPEDATVWLDGFQLVEGEVPQPYVPGSPLDLGIERTGEPGELLFASDTPLNATFSLRNNTDREQPVKLSAVLEEPSGNSTMLRTLNLTLLPGKNHRENIQVSATRTPGYRVVRLIAEMDGKTYQANLPFAVVKELPDTRRDSFFGLHPFGPIEPETLRRLGVVNIRNFRNWRFTPCRDGRYEFPENWRSMAHAGFRQQDCLNVAEPPQGNTEKESAVEFIRQATAFLGQDASWIELENEPDLIYPNRTGGDVAKAAETYAEMVNAAAEVIRAERPEARILACGVSGVDFSAGFPFTRRVLELAGKSIDILPVHPYSHARYIDENRNDIGPEANGVRDKVLQLRELIAACGGSQKISFGEVGWALDVHADPLSTEALRHAAYTVRLLLLGKALEVENVMFFLADYCIERDHYYYGLWRNTLPLPAAAAYATVARKLDGAKLHRTVSTGEVQCYTFLDGKGQPLAAVWTGRETPFDMELGVPPDSLEIRNMFDTPVSAPAGTVTRLRISGQPLYLTWRSGSAGEFTDLLAAAKVDLPPTRCLWRLLNDRRVSLQLTNERSVPLTATVKLSGATFLDAERTIELQPGRSAELEFDAAGSLNNRPLEMELTGNLGTQHETYRADLFPCPRRAPLPFCTDLPEAGRLPLLDNRRFLIPNDPNNGYDGADDLALASAVGFDDEYLYLDCNVTDDVHTPGIPGKLWAADSIQVAIDSRGDAAPNEYSFGKDDYEFTFGLTADGKPAAQIDYIYDRGRQEQARQALRCEIRRIGNLTVYRLAIPWRVLKIDPQPGTVFGLNFIANDNDGHGRLYWMGLTPGIGENKHPGAYRKFILTE